MDRRAFLSVLAFSGLKTPLAAAGQQAGNMAQARGGVAESLRVEWQRTTEAWRRPGIEGYVYNDSPYRIGGVRLRLETLGASDQVVSETFGWVYGNIRSGSRAYFLLPLPPGAERLRVTVESFHPIAREVPGESP
jgi:hypothetical protein